MGDACETKTNDWCLAGCSGRGECVRGFCHCRPPHYGLGCLKGAPKPQQKHPPGGHEHGQQHIPARSRLKIYMYDLPWQVAFQEGYFPGEGPGLGLAGACRGVLGELKCSTALRRQLCSRRVAHSGPATSLLRRVVWPRFHLRRLLAVCQQAR